MPEGSGDEVVELVGSTPDSEPSWWSRYEKAILEDGLSTTSVDVIEKDAAYIVERCLAAPALDSPSGLGGPVRTGLVMGAVQSGKTASMLGVTAKALDAGVDIVVILAGTRTALWRQTYDRAQSKLLGELAPTHRVLPSPRAVADEEADVRLDRLYAMNTHKAKRLLTAKTPLLLVVMKNVHHIRAAAEMLHASVFPHLETIDRTVRLLVMDDEADDGSILDANIEQGLDPNSDALKQVPRHIAGLWSQHGGGSTSVHEKLSVSYAAYTATPQANLLQADQNPLAPRDFLVALRTPGPAGELEPREPSYRDSVGLKGWYTGGEVFHRSLGPAALMVSDAAIAGSGVDDHTHQLAEVARAVRAYLVAGAVRLWRDGKRHPGATHFDSARQARDASPRPHSMLFHPSALVADHFAAAAKLLEFTNALAPHEAIRAVHEGHRSLSVEHLAQDIAQNESDWRGWIESYRATGDLVRDHFALADADAGPIPTDGQWNEIARLLIEDVIPYVRVAIINSEPSADDRPGFSPVRTEDGWQAAPDLATIFVSGNVMARGLTLEGLSTTLFLRSSGDPVADTQQQMQRWFGYRGEHLELCRVFLPRGQRELFTHYHEADEALRRQIIRSMNVPSSAGPPAVVLEGDRFRATGKISGISKVPLCPGASPLVRLIHPDGGTASNHEMVGQFLTRPSTPVTVAGTFRGHLLDEPLDLLQAAEFLEGLRYNGYAPHLEDPLAARWQAVEAQVGIGPEEPAPLFRPPSDDTAHARVRPTSCPYTIAAYFRLWHACLSRKARGLFPTDDGTTPWSALDLTRQSEAQPRFWLGIRNGSAERLEGAGFDQLDPQVALMRRTVDDDDDLRAGWGGRSDSQTPGSYLGDSRFDHHVHHDSPAPIDFAGTRWRPAGSDGLLLLMPVRVEGYLPVFAVGAVIPLGGPDHIAASRTVHP